MQRFQMQADRWHRVSGIMPGMQPLLKAGEFDRVEVLLDRVLEILETGQDTQALERIRQFQRETNETQYIILPVPEAGHLHGGNVDAFEEAIERTKRQLGRVASLKDRNWGFHLIIPAWRFDPEHLFNENASPKTISRAVEGAIEVAMRHDVAVHFTIENLEWGNRSDLWNYNDRDRPGYDPANRQNVEWMDWEGTPHPHRYRDWGQPERMPPVICYNSSAVRREVARLAEQVIGPAISTGLERLANADKLHLFAGVTVGAEPALPNYSVI
ncbi:MAG: hypothetical protein AAF664_09435, partial [Planctomycetota bacterium]